MPAPSTTPSALCYINLVYNSSTHYPFPPSVPSATPLTLPLPPTPLPPLPLPTHYNLVDSIIPGIESYPVLITSEAILLHNSPYSLIRYSMVDRPAAVVQSPQQARLTTFATGTQGTLAPARTIPWSSRYLMIKLDQLHILPVQGIDAQGLSIPPDIKSPTAGPIAIATTY